MQNSRQALGYLIDHVPVRVIHEGLAVGEMMKTRATRRRLDREGMAWDAQKGGERRTQFAQKVRGLMTEHWIERMTTNGQGEVYEQLTEHMWKMEGDIYGLQPGDHKYGKETSAALKHKRQARAEMMQSVGEVRGNAQG